MSQIIGSLVVEFERDLKNKLDGRWSNKSRIDIDALRENKKKNFRHGQMTLTPWSPLPL